MMLVPYYKFYKQYDREEYNPLINANTLVTVRFSSQGNSHTITFKLDTRETVYWFFDTASQAQYAYADLLSQLKKQPNTSAITVYHVFGDMPDEQEAVSKVAGKEGLDPSADQGQEKTPRKS